MPYMNKNTPRRRKLIYDCASNCLPLDQANSTLSENNEHPIKKENYNLWVRFVAPIGKNHSNVKDKSIEDGLDISWIGRYMKSLHSKKPLS